jgi:hypothetical protein
MMTLLLCVLVTALIVIALILSFISSQILRIADAVHLKNIIANEMLILEQMHHDH